MQLWWQSMMSFLLLPEMDRQAASRMSHPEDTTFPIARKGANARPSLLAPRRMSERMADSGAGFSRSRIDAEQGGEISEEPWIASLGVMRSRVFELHGLRSPNLDRQ